jgi:hypothetical protein
LPPTFLSPPTFIPPISTFSSPLHIIFSPFNWNTNKLELPPTLTPHFLSIAQIVTLTIPSISPSSYHLLHLLLNSLSSFYDDNHLGGNNLLHSPHPIHISPPQITVPRPTTIMSPFVPSHGSFVAPSLSLMDHMSPFAPSLSLMDHMSPFGPLSLSHGPYVSLRPLFFFNPKLQRERDIYRSLFSIVHVPLSLNPSWHFIFFY